MTTNPDGSSSRVEVITSVQRRRRWSVAEKLRLVEEAMQPGSSVSLVARQVGVAPSDHLELHARNGEVVRVLFAIDACDREIIAWSGLANAGISGEMVRDLMIAAVDVASARPKLRKRWNGCPTTAKVFGPGES